MNPQNNCPAFNQLPQQVQDAFDVDFRSTDIIPAGTKLYRFETISLSPYPSNLNYPPWWMPKYTYDDLVEFTPDDYEEYIRQAMALPHYWSDGKKGTVPKFVYEVTTTVPLAVIHGSCAAQTGIYNSKFPGGGYQYYIPDLKQDFITIDQQLSVRDVFQ